MEEIRIQKYFTDCGIMSRRAAEKAIADGRVRCNGRLALIGQKITPGKDEISLDGVKIRPTANTKKYIMLNKPRGYVTTLSDDRGRRTVSELVSDVGGRVYPVGRLDMDSEGLLILTDDGELTLRLTHPRHEIPKLYHVWTKGRITDAELGAIGNIRELDGHELAPVGLGLLSVGEKESLLCFSLIEGGNRQIRRMCEGAGIEINRLRRVAIGELSLGSLPPGRWRELTTDEVGYLYGRNDLKTKGNEK